MEQAAKRSAESRVEMLELVLPSDANPLGTIFGGKVMQWIDIAGSAAAIRHCRRPVVTASMDDLHFHAPIQVGEFALLEARLTAAFHTSVEVGVVVYSENPSTGERRLCTTALLTFVALGDDHRPTRAPPLLAETEEEARLMREAEERRQARLVRR